jgi:hypothetical protein
VGVMTLHTIKEALFPVKQFIVLLIAFYQTVFYFYSVLIIPSGVALTTKIRGFIDSDSIC